jgi:hypothetical protein
LVILPMRSWLGDWNWVPLMVWRSVQQRSGVCPGVKTASI